MAGRKPHNWDTTREAPAELILQLQKWLEDNDVRAKDLAQWLTDSGWLEKHDLSPFIAPPVNITNSSPPRARMLAWKEHMAACAEEMHERSHELNKSHGKQPGPTAEVYVDFAQRLHDALAYFYNCNSNPHDAFLEFDKQEMASRLRFAVAALGVSLPRS